MKDSAKHTTSSAACAVSSTHAEAIYVDQKIYCAMSDAVAAAECYASALLAVI